MSRALACLFLVVAGATLSACSPRHDTVRVERSVVLMGTVARFIAEAESREGALQRLERMVRVVEEVEAEISTWRADSHLSRINRQDVGVPLTIPARPCGYLGRVAHWWLETEGAFDPGVGSLIEAWGLREGGRSPSPAEIEAARGRAGFGRIRLDNEGCEVTRLSEVILDAGAFGKGAALDEVRREMAGQPGAWLIDFGGQIAGSDGDWPVALAHPDRRGVAALELRLTSGSLATSSGFERDVVTPDGRRIGHIIDPRTGSPVVRPGSVSVWHASALDADALSTALQVMGPGAGYQWAVERQVAACFLTAAPTPGGAVSAKATPGFARRFGNLCQGRVDIGAAALRPTPSYAMPTAWSRSS